MTTNKQGTPIASPVTEPTTEPTIPIATPEDKSPFEGISEEYKGIIENKGWKNVEDVLKGYSNVEKMASNKLGASPDSFIKKPIEGDEASLNNYRKALGVPETSDKYDFGLPEGADKSLVEPIAEVMHKHNVPASATKELAETYAQASEQLIIAKNEAEAKLIAAEWGGEKSETYRQNVEIAKQGAKALGYDNDMLINLQTKIGEAEMTRLFHKIGLANADVDTSKGLGSNITGSSTSSASAWAEINRLKNDTEFMNRRANGDIGAITTMSNLYKIAVPPRKS